VQIARIVAHRLGHAAQKGDHLMADFALDFADPGNFEAGFLFDPGGRCPWNFAKFRHRLGSQNLYVKPLLEPVFLGPNLAHLRTRVALNHRRSSPLHRRRIEGLKS
jgi:hypothetical protein